MTDPFIKFGTLYNLSEELVRPEPIVYRAHGAI